MSRFLAGAHSGKMKTLPLACVVMAAATAVTCSSRDAVLSFGQGGHPGSATGGASGGGGRGTGGTAGRSGGGTGGKAACETAECFRPYECVRACGGPVEYTGCCACVAPLFDNYESLACGGTSGTGGASGGAGGRAASGGAGGHPGTGGGHVASGGAGGGLVGSGGAAGRAGSGGTGGRPPADGGADARQCEQVQCLRPYECVRSCEGPIEYTGCCPCEAPLFDNFAGMGCDGGTGGAGGAGGSTCAQLRDGYAAALPTAKSCNPILSSRPPCDTSVSSVLGCSCKTYVDKIAPLQPYIDAWARAGCNVVCTAIACINAQARICDTTGASSPTEGTCRDTPP
jgi:hypothetical protein